MSATPYELEQIEIIERITERGIKFSLEYKDSEQLDLWQHAYDEVMRLKGAAVWRISQENK